MLKDPSEYDGKANEFKRQMMEGSFSVGKDEDKDLNWLFAVLDDSKIDYVTMSTPELIETAIQKSLSGRGKSSIAIPGNVIDKGRKEIVFPVVDLKKLQSIGYRENNKRKDDRISDLFGKYNKKIRFDIIEYIRKNPDLFLKRVVNLYGDRLTKIMRDKGLLDFPNQMDESKKDLSDVLRTKDIDPSEMEDLISQLTDEDITDLVLRNLERKFLKSGNPRTNARQYLERLVNSVKNREEYFI